MSANPKTLGDLVAEARAASGLSLRGLSEALLSRNVRMSSPFLSEVEHGTRRLNPQHWKAFEEVLPRLSLLKMAHGYLLSGKVTINARDLPQAMRNAMAAGLVAEAERSVTF
jgi:hypothetical protein